MNLRRTAVVSLSRTPLHCAASCNSVHLCKLLVESGAAIFASTISDVETAADKCEEMEEGYVQCSQFLYGKNQVPLPPPGLSARRLLTPPPAALLPAGVQEKLGVMNKGTVYALWDYQAQSDDELTFSEGDTISVLRRQDDSETDWWWARLDDAEGYVPRNLLGVGEQKHPMREGSGRAAVRKHQSLIVIDD